MEINPKCVSVYDVALWYAENNHLHCLMHSDRVAS